MRSCMTLGILIRVLFFVCCGLQFTLPAGVVGALGNIGAFVFYARLLNVLSFVLIFFLMPGTEIIHQFFSFFLLYFKLRKALDIKEKEKPLNN